MLERAPAHKGTAFVEIYQNCKIFNDGVFDTLKDRDTRDDATLRLRQWRAAHLRHRGWAGRSAGPPTASLGEVCGADDPGVLVHDAHAADPSQQFALSRLTGDTHGVTPIGVFRDVDVPSYDEELNGQIDRARERGGSGDLMKLIAGKETWAIA